MLPHRLEVLSKVGFHCVDYNIDCKLQNLCHPNLKHTVNVV